MSQSLTRTLRSTRLAFVVLVASLGNPLAHAEAAPRAPVLHEPLPPDAREDMSFDLTLDGNVPAAIETPRGLVSAPDPRRPLGPDDRTYQAPSKDDAESSTFEADRDTRRPDVLPYDDPFTPSTAPFKRLTAFDAVDASYTLFVRAKHLEPLTVSAAVPVAPGEQSFYADLVVDLSPDAAVRIPSVGPGTRILRARAGVGSEDVPIHLYRDGADNWFVSAKRARRVRLVMELAIARRAFGGDYGDPNWSALPRVTALPSPVARAASEVARTIGVAGPSRPRDKLTKLVAYFRSFADSDEPPPRSGNIYLDLALSRKGVCRHRAFAFMVTALAVGLPTRMVVNEAHAWVEVHDSRAWRRIDLGGAGRALVDPRASAMRYEPPADPFAWPHGATRGDDLGRRAHRQASGERAGASGVNGAGTGAAGTGQAGAQTETSSVPPRGSAEPPDERPASSISMKLAQTSARRGAPVAVTGTVSSGGNPCAHVAVEIVLHRGTGGETTLGTLATDDGGAFGGTLVLPELMPLGDYDVRPRTPGNARCGPGGAR